MKSIYYSIIFVVQLLALTLAFVAGAFVDTHAQSTVKLQSLTEPAKSVQVRVIQKGKIAYGSLNDIIAGLQIPGKKVTESRQIEIQTKEYNLRVTPENSFISITDAKHYTSLVQLPFATIQQGNDIYVPLEAFIDIFNDVTPEAVTFNKSNSSVTVAKVTPSSTFDISKVSIEQRSNGYLLRIFSGKKINDYESWVKQVDDGTWLYITLPGVRADIKALQSNRPGGAIKDLMAFQSPTSLQLTFKLNAKVRNTELMKTEGSNDLLVSIHTQQDEETHITKIEETLERTRNRWKLDCIVLDAGHGGHDPGTIGVKKTREKDVTLAITLKLGELLEKNMSDVKVVYTRKDDRFIELYRRGQIANAEGGKLFISIHCNSTPRKPSNANGFEIYLLRPGKTESAVQIASRENEVVKLETDYQKRYQELTEEQFILVTMAQNAYVRYSEQFAGILQNEMLDRLPGKSKGVKQAGFYVLVGASMPNVLIETGYLSNKKEEQYLKTAQGQNELAEAIFEAVKRYKSEYEKSLEEGIKETGGR